MERWPAPTAGESPFEKTADDCASSTTPRSPSIAVGETTAAMMLWDHVVLIALDDGSCSRITRGTLRPRALAPSATRTAWESADGTMRVLGLPPDVLVGERFRPSSRVLLAQFSTSEQEIVLVLEDRVEVRRVHDGEIVRSLREVSDQRLGRVAVTGVTSIATSPAGDAWLLGLAGKLFLVNPADGTAIHWDDEPGRMAAFSPDGTHFARQGADGATWVHRAAGGDHALPPLRHDARPSAIGFAPDGRLVIASGNNVRLWRIEPTGRRYWTTRTATLAGWESARNLLARWRLSASGTADALVILDPVTGGTTSFRGASRAGAAAFSPRGNLLAAIDADDALVVWDLADRSVRCRTGAGVVASPLGGQAPLAFSRGEERLYVALAHDDGVAAFTTESCEVVVPPRGGRRARVGIVRGGPGGRLVASASDDGVVEVVDATTLDLVRAVDAGPSLADVHLATDDAHLVTIAASGDTGGSFDACAWKIGPPPPERDTCLRHTSSVRSQCVATRRGLEAVVERTGGVQVVDLVSGRAGGPAILLEARVVQAALAPDGSIVATLVRSSGASRVDLWDVESGLTVGLPEWIDDETWRGVRMGFTPDGSRLVVALSHGDDVVDRVFDVPAAEEEEAADLAELAEVLAARRINETGSLEPIKAAVSRRRELAQRYARAPCGTASVATLGRWLLDDPDQRTLTPLTCVAADGVARTP